MSVAKIKKGNKVIMCGFTGMKLGVYAVTAADAKTITIEKADGTEVEFSRKTGKQLNPNNPKYANFIIEDDGSYVNPRDAKNLTGKPKKKAASEKKGDVEDEEEEEAPKSKTKSKAKSKTKPAVEDVEDVEDEEDEEDYEEVE